VTQGTFIAELGSAARAALRPLRLDEFDLQKDVQQMQVNALGCIFLHPRQDVAVKVKRNPDLGMPETFARHLGMNAACE
jgi:hypothetical protein